MIGRSRVSKFDRLLFGAVLALALSIAVSMYRGYLDDPSALWRDIYHDRHGHYGFALDLALHLRSFDLLGFLSELEKSKVWPPLHGLVLGTLLAVAGPDYRLAVLPNIAAWVAVVALTWLCARALFAERIAGWIAGALAVAFTAASPALRLIATDVMLDVPGAALSALALLTFMRACAAVQDRWRWRWFALTLTALFFEKSNYFMLVAVALALTWLTFPGQLRETRKLAREIFRTLPPLRRLGTDPFVLSAAGITLVVIAIQLRGPTAITLFGEEVSLYPPRNLVTVAYALIFARLALAWRRHHDVLNSRLSVAARAIFYCTVVPIAISLLLPQRLAILLWYIGPTHAGAHGAYGLANSAQVYGRAFFDAFSVARWAGYVALAFFAVALANIHRLTRYARAALIFASLSAVVVLVHPQHQGRFLTTFVFAIWIGAGAGLALLVKAFAARESLRAAIGGVAVVAMSCALFMQEPNRSAAAAVALHRLTGPSDLELVEAYAPFVSGREPIAVASTFGPVRLLDWPLAERHRRKVRMDIFRAPEGERAAVRAAAERWLAQTQGERLLVLDFPDFARSAQSVWSHYHSVAGMLDAVAAQNRFVLEQTIEMPAFRGSIGIWRKR